MREVAEELLSRSLARGAAQAEALVKKGATRSVSLEAAGGVAWTRTAEGGVALRIMRESGASGFASACGLEPTEELIDHIVAAALDAARAPGTMVTLPTGRGGDGRGLGIYDPRLHATTPADLEGLLDEAATEALKCEPRVRRLESATIAVSSTEVWMQNSRGFTGGYRQTLMHLALGVVAGEAGASVVVRRSRTARSCSAFSHALFGDETARLAVTALEGRPAGGGTYSAVLAPAAAAEVLRLLARRLSPPGPAPGTPIGSRLLNVIDDGRLPGGIATAPFDGEGTPTRRTLVVGSGVAREMIHDLGSAARAGSASTGNGVRASFRDAPRHMTTNLFIAPGSDSPAELLSSLGDGLWIQTLRPTAAVVSDETMLVASGTGRWVKQGRPDAPLTGSLVIRSLTELLSGISGVGNDLTFGIAGSGLGAPSLLLDAVELKAP